MSSHVRDVGPHAHEWASVMNDGNVFFQACQVCGTRRLVSRDPRFDPVPVLTPWQQCWLEGGPLPGDDGPTDVLQSAGG